MNYTILAAIPLVVILFIGTAEAYLYDFNYGNMVNGTRHFTLVAEENKTISISASGPHQFDAWTFNGTVPGPTLRMTEGDNVSITVINSPDSKLPHSLHLHSTHPGIVDGVTGDGGNIMPGENFTYSFVAQPYGLYPYHCHVEPVDDHINRGLYGAMVIDPKTPRENMTEMVMMMNAYDMDKELEGGVTIKEVEKDDPTQPKKEEEVERDNEIYTVNGRAFEYMGENTIPMKAGEKYRIYLVNMVEFDPVNSFHIHGNMFDYIVAGTSMEPDFVHDLVTIGQGDRGIVEFTPKYPGDYMFHSHINEFSSLGWMGFFSVQ